jgi:cytoskeletal protein CcmA (bactofilin family)
MVFKKTEETEWTRFSKALSPRDREDAEADDPEATAGHPIAPTPAPMTRQAASDVNVSARSANRAPATETDEEVESVIGEHTSVDGTFKSENSIRIRGTVQGEIESQRAILVEAQANVNAKVTASNITVAGQVNGQIFCSGRVELRPSGRVIGEINAGTLIMQEGAFFEGHLKMGGGGGATSGTPTPEPVGAKKS